jgi:hypothetical protein
MTGLVDQSKGTVLLLAGSSAELVMESALRRLSGPVPTGATSLIGVEAFGGCGGPIGATATGGPDGVGETFSGGSAAAGDLNAS